MIRMRTLTETMKCVKEQDPETALTANALRKMVITGQVPHIKAGKKYLIDIDGLTKYLSGNAEPKNVSAQEDTHCFILE